MNKISSLCGHQRPANLKEPCPECGSKAFIVDQLYLRPEEARGLKVAVSILIVVTLLVIIGLAAMYLILGNQIAFVPQQGQVVVSISPLHIYLGAL